MQLRKFLVTACLLLTQGSFADSSPITLEGELSYGQLSDFHIQVDHTLEDKFALKRYRISAKYLFQRDPIERAFSSIRRLGSNEIVLIVSTSLGSSNGTSELTAEFTYEVEATKRLKIHVLEGDPLNPSLRLLGEY